MKKMTMREIVEAEGCASDLDYLVKQNLFPTDFVDWDDAVWELIERSHDNGGYSIYEGAGLRLTLSQAEPQLVEI